MSAWAPSSAAAPRISSVTTRMGPTSSSITGAMAPSWTRPPVRVSAAAALCPQPQAAGTLDCPAPSGTTPQASGEWDKSSSAHTRNIARHLQWHTPHRGSGPAVFAAGERGLELLTIIHFPATGIGPRPSEPCLSLSINFPFRLPLSMSPPHIYLKHSIQPNNHLSSC